MKRLLLTAAIFALSAPVFAQDKASYCDLDVYRPGFNKYIATADYGNGSKIRVKTSALKDGAGKIIKFRSELEAVNYMAKQGWEIVSTYHNKGGSTHFFMKKVA